MITFLIFQKLSYNPSSRLLSSLVAKLTSNSAFLDIFEKLAMELPKSILARNVGLFSNAVNQITELPSVCDSTKKVQAKVLGRLFEFISDCTNTNQASLKNVLSFYSKQRNSIQGSEKSVGNLYSGGDENTDFPSRANNLGLSNSNSKKSVANLASKLNCSSKSSRIGSCFAKGKLLDCTTSIMDKNIVGIKENNRDGCLPLGNATELSMSFKDRSLCTNSSEPKWNDKKLIPFTEPSNYANDRNIGDGDVAQAEEIVESKENVSAPKRRVYKGLEEYRKHKMNSCQKTLNSVTFDKFSDSTHRTSTLPNKDQQNSLSSLPSNISALAKRLPNAVITTEGLNMSPQTGVAMPMMVDTGESVQEPSHVKNAVQDRDCQYHIMDKFASLIKYCGNNKLSKSLYGVSNSNIAGYKSNTKQIVKPYLNNDLIRKDVTCSETKNTDLYKSVILALSCQNVNAVSSPVLDEKKENHMVKKSPYVVVDISDESDSNESTALHETSERENITLKTIFHETVGTGINKNDMRIIEKDTVSMPKRKRISAFQRLAPIKDDAVKSIPCEENSVLRRSKRSLVVEDITSAGIPEWVLQPTSKKLKHEPFELYSDLLPTDTAAANATCNQVIYHPALDVVDIVEEVEIDSDASDTVTDFEGAKNPEAVAASQCEKNNVMPTPTRTVTLMKPQNLFGKVLEENGDTAKTEHKHDASQIVVSRTIPQLHDTNNKEEGFYKTDVLTLSSNEAQMCNKAMTVGRGSVPVRKVTCRVQPNKSRIAIPVKREPIEKSQSGNTSSVEPSLIIKEAFPSGGGKDNMVVTNEGDLVGLSLSNAEKSMEVQLTTNESNTEFNAPSSPESLVKTIKCRNIPINSKSNYMRNISLANLKSECADFDNRDANTFCPENSNVILPSLGSKPCDNGKYTEDAPSDRLGCVSLMESVVTCGSMKSPSTTSPDLNFYVDKVCV